MTTMILGVALLIMGVFCIVSGVWMKQTNKVPKWMLKGVEVKTTSDVPGFVGSMWYKNLFLGAVIITFGAYRMVTEYVPDFPTIVPENVMIGAFLLVLIAYMMMLTNAKREFFEFTR